MKIVVFGHWLEVGGTQVNAIDIATELRDRHGHDVTYFATPGPLLALVKERGLRFVPAPAAGIHPSPARMMALRDILLRERPDVIHVWDWWQCLDAYYVAHLWMRIPMVVTDMSMSLYHLLPKSLNTTFGTQQLVDQARSTGRRRLSLVMPPVDLNRNAPGAVDCDPFKARFWLKDTDINIAIICRLSYWMKSEGVMRAIGAVRTLGRRYPLRLIIAGNGDARARLDRLARETNKALGRPAIVLTGALLDPRPLYSAADIVIGMGGSALRGMAFGKPVIVVGEQGFSAPLTPQTADFFLYQGIYGIGDGDPGNTGLTEQLRTLARQRDLRQSLGAFSRDFVLRYFDLEKVGAQLEKLLCLAAAETPRRRIAAFDGLRTAVVWIKERRFIPVSWRVKISKS